jgi:hypothetical protein
MRIAQKMPGRNGPTVKSRWTILHGNDRVAQPTARPDGEQLSSHCSGEATEDPSLHSPDSPRASAVQRRALAAILYPSPSTMSSDCCESSKKDAAAAGDQGVATKSNAKLGPDLGTVHVSDGFCSGRECAALAVAGCIHLQ